MSTQSAAPKSRRALLGAALGAAVATVAGALGRPTPARAVDGDAVAVGGEYTSATSVTKISNTSNGADVWGAASTNGIGFHGASTNSAGVHGESSVWYGVRGDSVSQAGVAGFSSSGVGVNGDGGSAGVYGQSDSGVAVVALTQDGTAIYASSVNGIGLEVGNASASDPCVQAVSQANTTAVVGRSGTNPVTLPPKTGVYGFAVQDSAARGVFGQTTAGQGVRGVATTGIGVRGFSESGVAGSLETTSGIALATKGRLRFADVAGRSTIGSGTSSVVVNPGIDLTSSSFVLATLNGNAGGATTVKRVAINPVANTFTVYLTANATAAVKVAWFVLEE